MHANKPSEAELDALATSCNLCEEAVKYARSWSNDETVRDKQALDDLFMDACTRIKSELGDRYKWRIADCEATRHTIVDDMDFGQIIASQNSVSAEEQCISYGLPCDMLSSTADQVVPEGDFVEKA